MARGDARKGLEQQLAELNALRDEPDTPEARAALAKALDATRAPLVAAAANVIGEAELTGFAPALGAAFARFLELPAKSDAGCVVKTSCARALYRLGERATEVFLRGIAHVQMEPVWGGQQDTAIELRGTSALGLVRAGYPDALVELADLLADKEPMARVAAAQAIAYSERQDIGVPLLRMKARLGDDDPRVTAACFSALFSLSPELSLPYVASFLDADKLEVQEAALIRARRIAPARRAARAAGLHRSPHRHGGARRRLHRRRPLTQRSRLGLPARHHPRRRKSRRPRIARHPRDLPRRRQAPRSRPGCS